MSKPKKFINRVRAFRLSRLKDRLHWKKKEFEVRAKVHESSHSLLWVWEFSKKAVLICFLFYVVIQFYSMVVMVVTSDYTNLGELITQAGELVRDCVFGYFVKAGIENVCKIVFTDEAEG